MAKQKKKEYLIEAYSTEMLGDYLDIRHLPTSPIMSLEAANKKVKKLRRRGYTADIFPVI